MKWLEAKIVFDHPDSDLAADLIADVFYEFGLQGVVVDDPDIEPVEDWAEDALGRTEHHAITGYIHLDGRADSRCKILEAKLGQLKITHNLICRVTYKEIDEQDWAHAWKAYFRPQKITPNIVVKPTWFDYQADRDEIVIELDPGMAFGTGTHPTTGLCINMMENYLNAGDSFLDIGTGSGILMVAAAKMGAGRLCGVDKDEVALAVANQNLELNNVNPQMFHLITSNLGAQINESYNFIVANIYSHVILKLLCDIPRLLTAGGIFICSGIFQKSERSVLAAMEELEFEVLEMAVKEEWVAIAARLQAESSRHYEHNTR